MLLLRISLGIYWKMSHGAHNCTWSLLFRLLNSTVRAGCLRRNFSTFFFMPRGSVIFFAVQRNVACIHLNVFRLAEDLCNLFERDAFRLLRKNVSTCARRMFSDDRYVRRTSGRMNANKVPPIAVMMMNTSQYFQPVRQPRQ